MRILSGRLGREYYGLSLAMFRLISVTVCPRTPFLMLCQSSVFQPLPCRCGVSCRRCLSAVLMHQSFQNKTKDLSPCNCLLSFAHHTRTSLLLAHWPALCWCHFTGTASQFTVKFEPVALPVNSFSRGSSTVSGSNLSYDNEDMCSMYPYLVVVSFSLTENTCTKQRDTKPWKYV